ncbi:hypothetical protein OPIT5_00395 (plasmid) [Opitutaceae bacterium TAV5]|nr:hypothetical protein OPIT5_00395 [Opitutaceae bacterium TAV5]
MNIALISKKGGPGKTTLSILLNEALLQTNQSVSIRDYDEQGSASKVLRILCQNNDTQNIPLESLGSRGAIRIFDTPPDLTSAATRAAALESDVILIPTSPDPLDMQEVEEAYKFATRTNPNAVVRIVLNKVRANTILGEAAASFLKQIGELLPATLNLRESYKHASLKGWNSLDSAAQKELLKFTTAVTLLLPIAGAATQTNRR